MDNSLATYVSDAATLISSNAFAITCLLLIIALFVRWGENIHPRFPPGPKGLPLLGVTPFVGPRLEVTLAKWSVDEYGPIMSVRLGTKDCVVLSSFNVIHEAFVKQSRDFVGRNAPHVLTQSCGDKGVLFRSYSDDYKHQRKFGIQTLKRLGFERHHMESHILKEVNYLIEDLHFRASSSVNILPLLTRTTANVISTMVLGRRFKGNESQYKKIMDVLGLLTDPHLGVLVLYENSRFLPYLSSKNTKFKRKQLEMIDIFKSFIEEHKATYKEGTVRDFIDAFIFEQKRNSHGSFSDEQLAVYIRDLFVAGSESTSSTVAWALICFLTNPKYKKLIVDEIRDAFKQKGRSSLTKKDKLPLTQAFLQEVLRLHCVAPIIHRKTTKDTNLQGFFIPKDTEVLANLHAVLTDPKVWPNPRAFEPKRHISKDGSFVYSSKIIPFSIGGRYCMGESLARAELFHIFTSILLNFDIESNGELPSADEKMSSLLSLAPDFSINLNHVKGD